jgi:WD40 repeat protein
VLLWDLTTAQASGQYADHGGHITSLTSSSGGGNVDGPVFYSGDQKGTVRALDSRIPKAVASSCVHPGGAVNELALCPSQRGEGRLLVSAGADGKVHVLDTRYVVSPTVCMNAHFVLFLYLCIYVALYS